MSTLFVNACLRGPQSRTLALCRTHLAELGGSVEEVDLGALALAPLGADDIARRQELLDAGRLDDPTFALARQLARAERVVVGAPYWDLSFPTALKAYVEHVSVCGIAFRYTEEGRCEGLCRARSLTYVTTCGGQVGANLGFAYLQAIAEMFGIKEARCVAAENLDVWGCDVEAQLACARAHLHELAR